MVSPVPMSYTKAIFIYWQTVLLSWSTTQYPRMWTRRGEKYLSCVTFTKGPLFRCVQHLNERSCLSVGLSVCWSVGWSVCLSVTPERFSPINHERIIGSLWYLHIWLVLLRQKNWPKVKITRSKVKVKHASLQKKSLRLYTMSQWFDVDDTYTHDWYQ